MLELSPRLKQDRLQGRPSVRRDLHDKSHRLTWHRLERQSSEEDYDDEVEQVDCQSVEEAQVCSHDAQDDDGRRSARDQRHDEYGD